MATIFSDGFESNDFSAWTGTTGSGTHLETVENLNPHHGTYNAKFYTASTDDFSCVYKDITSSPIVYCGLYCKFSALPVNDGEILFVGLTQNVSSGLGVGPVLYKNEGSLYWGLKIDGTVFFEVDSSNPVVDTWYCVEFLRDVTNNIETLWVDGVVKVNQTRVIANNSDRVFFGNTWINYATPTSIYVDCCVVSDGYIGMEQVPAPTLAPAGGTYNGAQNVAMTCTRPAASIYYTEDNSAPTDASTAYGAPVVVAKQTTLKAIAYETAMTPSPVTTEKYQIISQHIIEHEKHRRLTNRQRRLRETLTVITEYFEAKQKLRSNIN